MANFVQKLAKGTPNQALTELFDEFRKTIGSHFCAEMTKRIGDFDLHSFLKELRFRVCEGVAEIKK